MLDFTFTRPFRFFFFSQEKVTSPDALTASRKVLDRLKAFIFGEDNLKTNSEAADESETASQAIKIHAAPSVPVIYQRQDILNLDRDKLLKEILDMKRRSKDRSYPRDVSLMKTFETHQIKVKVNHNCSNH